MAEPNTDIQNPDNQTPTGDSPGEDLTLETIVGLDPADLTDEQKTTLEEKKADLTPEQAEKFGIELEEKEPEDIDPKKVKIKTRTPEPKKKGEPEPTGDDDEVDPEDKKTISKIVDDKLTDFTGKLDEVQKVKDQQEVSDFVADRPEFKPYRGVMLKYLAHPAYKNIPVENIAKIVAGEDLQKLGAKKEREAAEKAKATQDSGTTVRKPSKGKTDWQTASKEEFEKKKNEVMGIRV